MPDHRQPSIILRLPLELRERIYNFCYNDDESAAPTWKFNEPAITRISKAIRSEALPLYYGAYPLIIQSYVKCDARGCIWFKTNRSYRQLLASKISWIRRLRIRFGFSEHYFGEPVAIEFTIELDQRHGGYSINHCFGEGWTSDARDPAEREEILLILKHHLTESLTTSIATHGIGHFTVVDLDRLVDVNANSLP